MAWDFLGVNFWSRDFFFGGGGVVGSLRDFFGFGFLSPFDDPRHLKSGVTPGASLAFITGGFVVLCAYNDFAA